MSLYVTTGPHIALKKSNPDNQINKENVHQDAKELSHDEKGVWVLDNGSTLSIGRDESLVDNIRPTLSPIEMSTNAGVKNVTKEADLPGYGTIWHDKTNIANIFALCDIENQLFSAASRSNLKAKIDAQMEQNDRHWRRFYDVPEGEQLLYRHYSYSDRIRYYWTDPEIQQAFTALIGNLTHTEIPLPLLSQYLPVQYDAVSQGDINCTPEALIIHNIMQVTERYAAACRPSVQ